MKNGMMICCAILMLLGSAACQGSRQTARIVDPTGKTVKVNLDAVAEYDLPQKLAWTKAHRSAAYKKAHPIGNLKEIVFDPPIDPARRLERVKADAQNGRTGSSPVYAFNEMVSEIAQHLVSKLPAERKTATKQVLVLAPVDNQLPAGALETPGLQLAQEWFLSQLLNNDAVRARFILLSRSSVPGKEALEAAMSSKTYELPDPADFSGSAVPRVPNDIYLITPRFSQDLDIDSGRVIFHLAVDVQCGNADAPDAHLWHRSNRTYYFHPYQQQWLSQAQNDDLRRRFFEVVGRRQLSNINGHPQDVVC